MVSVNRTGILMKPDASRVFFRPFIPGNIHRMRRIHNQVDAMTEEQTSIELARIMEEFRHRHKQIEVYLMTQFNNVCQELQCSRDISENRKLLIGACFTQEYSMESAALFNPSIILHPDQTNLSDGDMRFIISLRATGEGHISSIVFRSGTIKTDQTIVIETPTRYVTSAEIKHPVHFDKSSFSKKLYELGIMNNFSDSVMGLLDQNFDLNQLINAIDAIRELPFIDDYLNSGSDMVALARNNYEVTYTADKELSERIIFPYGANESNGIEDARFVRFLKEDGSFIYYATYTAYNGSTIYPQLLETEDFLHFRISTLNGNEASNKGMALFPRKINGKFWMISRQDGENIFVMHSDRVFSWRNKQLILKPKYTWEYVQMGNCGSPIETEAGWLVLSHGVGPMRKYSIGAFLLDLDDPTKLIGRLEQPLMSPDMHEREGYVPNVVYSCGAMLHGETLIIPYAMSDSASSIATVNMEELLAAMV
ncbi:MAG: glycoside hydrolase family 130 protein [Bacteroidota bacterium]|nr:glycoside hydrolase family 130 protein [Bacteroidota bacterium]